MMKLQARKSKYSTFLYISLITDVTNLLSSRTERGGRNNFSHKNLLNLCHSAKKKKKKENADHLNTSSETWFKTVLNKINIYKYTVVIHC